MKKKFITAMTTALVVGAASTTFAAANPFSDVPAGHWAYDAVTQLAADGIVEGYGDGTYLGNKTITRYEMAQMVAKAMAKGGNVSGADKAALDRLQAEFQDELDNLGVRVSELEKYSDKVKWTGEFRYRYISDRREGYDNNGTKIKTKKNQDWVHFRLFPTAEVNKHWKVKARMTASYNMDKDDTGTFNMTYGFAEGTYDKVKLSVGKMPFYSNVDDGLVMDDFFSGARVEVGSKWKLNLEAGRWNLKDANGYIGSAFAEREAEDGTTYTLTDDTAASYQGVELSYDTGSKFMIGGSYKHFNSDAFKFATRYNVEGKVQDDADIWSAAVAYNFDKNVKLFYTYAQNPTADEYNMGYTAQLSYKGSNKKKNSWGAWAAYRYVGNNVALAPTYDTYTKSSNKKGVELGVNWSPLDNTLTSIQYFNGKTLDTDLDTDVLFGRVSWFF